VRACVRVTAADEVKHVDDLTASLMLPRYSVIAVVKFDDMPKNESGLHHRLVLIPSSGRYITSR
jgi:hypothetical protein